MCGIAGIVRRAAQAIDPIALKRMCDVQAHRGPDDAGYVLIDAGRAVALVEPRFAHLTPHLPTWDGYLGRRRIGGNRIDAALGHRRLSILDLSAAGHQPMCSHDQRYWIVYNGELYNSPELRDDLSARGIRFAGRSDTEVLLYAWTTYGPAVLPRLNGMYAFAILDRAERTLTLARDRFGVKPLYHATTPQFFLFASEIKALFASGYLAAELSPPALAEYLTFQNLLGKHMLFRHVELLEPGSYRTVALDGAVGPVRKYFTCYAEPPSCAPLESFEETCAETRGRFIAAVKRQLLSDVPVGSYLSGGMDSGAIVGVAAGELNRLRTFTLGMCLQGVAGMESLFDERAQAEILSNAFQTEHYAGILRPLDLPTLIQDLTWHLDDPRVGMCHQNYHVARLASRMVKVCLSGTGGDELFGGYPWRYAQGIHCDSVDAFDRAYFRYWHRLIPPERHELFFSREIQREVPGVWERFRGVMNAGPAPVPELPLVENLLQRALAFEFSTFLQGLFIVEDRVSMAHSLEVRVPFLDNALADHAFRMRPNRKVRLEAANSNSMAETSGKWVLRQAMKRLLPESFTDQRKQGFCAPEANWYRGPLLDYLREILLDPRAEQRFYLKRGTLARVLQEHEAASHNHRLLLWSLLSLEWLNRHYLDASVVHQAAA